MAWWSSFLTARRSQRGHVIAEIDFHTAVGGEVLARSMRLDVAVAVRARDREVPKNLAREHVRRAVEAAHKCISRGLRFLLLSCARGALASGVFSLSRAP